MKSNPIFNIFLYSFLLFGIFSQASALPGDPEHGEKVYKQSCAGCHGKEGEGNGIGATHLIPIPRDFTAGYFKYKTTQGEGVPSDEDLYRTITLGLPGTGMPTWGDKISEQDRWDIISYIKLFSDDLFEDEEYRTPIIEYSGKILPSPQSVSQGKELFLKKAGCSECHGQEGKGDGMKALKDDLGVRVWPRNLTQPWFFRGGSEPKDIFSRISIGIPGTPMPSFAEGPKALSQEERWHIANYVVSLADERKKPKSEENIIHGVFIKEIPYEIDSPVWDSVKSTALPLVRRIPGKKRMFYPTNTTLLAKCVFDDEKIAFLLEWDDRTRSVEGDKEVLFLSEERELYQDAVAIQLPQSDPDSLEDPKYYWKGGKNLPVHILQWAAGNEKETDIAKVFNAGGSLKNTVETSASKTGLKVIAKYRKGVWKILMTRRLETTQTGDYQFRSVKYIPVMFANWDGSRQGNGDNHYLTKWARLLLGEPTGLGIFSQEAINSDMKLARNVLAKLKGKTGDRRIQTASATPKEIKKVSKRIKNLKIKNMKVVGIDKAGINKKKLYRLLTSYLIFKKFETPEINIEAGKLWKKKHAAWTPQEVARVRALIQRADQQQQTVETPTES